MYDINGQFMILIITITNGFTISNINITNGFDINGQFMITIRNVTNGFVIPMANL